MSNEVIRVIRVVRVTRVARVFLRGGGGGGGWPQVVLVYASAQCIEQWSCRCSQLWHSAPPRMAVGWL